MVFSGFCIDHNVSFPLQLHDTAICADHLCALADKHDNNAATFSSIQIQALRSAVELESAGSQLPPQGAQLGRGRGMSSRGGWCGHGHGYYQNQFGNFTHHNSFPRHPQSTSED